MAQAGDAGGRGGDLLGARAGGLGDDPGSGAEAECPLRTPAEGKDAPGSCPPERRPPPGGLWKPALAAVFCLALAGAPLALNAYWVDVLNSVGLYALLALSLNVILGEAGLFNMGHAAFYAVGAYTAAIVNTRYQIPILWALPLAGLAAGVFGAVLARPVIHLRGDYLLIVTIGVGEIVRIALVNDVFGLTGGANGIFGIGRPLVFGVKIRTPQQFFYLIWAFVALTVLLFHRLKQSRFGRALNYLREDEVAAEGSGIPTARTKLLAFALGAAWAGMTGTLYAAKMTIISPESFSFWESVILFMIVILGGQGSIAGVLVGTFLIVGLPEVFRGFASARMLVFGLVMMVMMVFRTQGLVPHRPRSFDLRGLKVGGRS